MKKILILILIVIVSFLQVSFGQSSDNFLDLKLRISNLEEKVKALEYQNEIKKVTFKIGLYEETDSTLLIYVVVSKNTIKKDAMTLADSLFKYYINAICIPHRKNFHLVIFDSEKTCKRFSTGLDWTFEEIKEHLLIMACYEFPYWLANEKLH